MTNACLIWLSLKLSKAWLDLLSIVLIYPVARLASTVLGDNPFDEPYGAGSLA